MAGHIDKRPNGRYRARFKPPGGDEVSKTYDRQGDAQNWLINQQADWARGVWIDPRASQTRFGAYAVEFLGDRVHVRIRTVEIDETNLRLHILPTFKDRPFRAITRRSVQSWVSALTKAGMAPSTVHSVFNTFNKIVRGAVLDRLIAESPCVKIDLPEVTSDVTIPTNRQLLVVEGRLPVHWRRALSTAKGTGLRGGELFGLTADRVGFMRRRTIIVDRQRQRLPGLQAHLDELGKLPAQYRGSVPLGGGWFLVPVKSKRSRREIPVGEHTLGVLAAQIAEFPPDDEVGLLFRTSRGLPVSRAALADGWERATRKRLGKDPSKPDPGEKDGARDPSLGAYFTPHDARHFYASMLIAKGIGVTRVAACLGDTEEVVLRTYAHLWPSDEHAVREAVDGELDGLEPEVGANTAWTRPGAAAVGGRSG